MTDKVREEVRGFGSIVRGLPFQRERDFQSVEAHHSLDRNESLRGRELEHIRDCTEFTYAFLLLAERMIIDHWNGVLSSVENGGEKLRNQGGHVIQGFYTFIMSSC